MRYLAVIFSFFVFFSCKDRIKTDHLRYLNGYWEIEKVVMPDNSVKEYQGNTIYEYIEISDNKGFRKKVYPKMLGGFQTNDDSEFLELVQDEQGWKIIYTNEKLQWIEFLQSLSEDKFSIKNEEGIKYFYKKVKQN